MARSTIDPHGTVVLEEEVSKLSVRMDRVEDTTEKTLAIVQGLVTRVDRLETKVDHALTLILDRLSDIERKLDS